MFLPDLFESAYLILTFYKFQSTRSTSSCDQVVILMKNTHLWVENASYYLLDTFERIQYTLLFYELNFKF